MFLFTHDLFCKQLSDEIQEIRDFFRIVSIHRIGWYIDPQFPDADDRTCSIPSLPDIERIVAGEASARSSLHRMIS